MDHPMSLKSPRMPFFMMRVEEILSLMDEKGILHYPTSSPVSAAAFKDQFHAYRSALRLACTAEHRTYEPDKYTLALEQAERLKLSHSRNSATIIFQDLQRLIEYKGIDEIFAGRLLAADLLSENSFSQLEKAPRIDKADELIKTLYSNKPLVITPQAKSESDSQILTPAPKRSIPRPPGADSEERAAPPVQRDTGGQEPSENSPPSSNEPAP